MTGDRTRKARAHGEGSIYQRSDGRWCAFVPLQGGRRKYVYGRTKAECRAKWERAKQTHDRGGALPDERLTVGAYLAEWLATDAALSARPRTVEGYRSHVVHHLVPAIGDKRLSRLTARDVRTMVAGLSDKGLSPMTVQHIRATLRRALNRAVALELVTRNVAAGPAVTLPRTTGHVVTAMTRDRARELLAAFEGTDMQLPVTVAILTGLRQGEQRALRWADVDLAGGSLMVRHAFERRADGEYLAEPKTATSRRTLRLSPELVAMLRAHKASQGRARLAAGAEWHDGGAGGFVFDRGDGRPLAGSALTHRFQGRVADAGLPPLRWHDLRHACATLMLARGEDLRRVMEQLGHASITTTMNTYGHLAPATMQETADELSRWLLGSG